MGREEEAQSTSSMEEEEDEEISSDSDSSDSSDEYSIDYQEEESDDGDGQARESMAQHPPSDEDLKSKNVDALLRGNLIVRRQPLLPRVLSVTEGAPVCRKPFKLPCSNGFSDWERFVPWGSSRPVLVPITNRLDINTTDGTDVVEEAVTLPPGVDPLVLWKPEESEDGPNNLVPIAVDPLLVRFIRPHQRYCSSVRTPKFITPIILL